MIKRKIIVLGVLLFTGIAFADYYYQEDEATLAAADEVVACQGATGRECTAWVYRDNNDGSYHVSVVDILASADGGAIQRFECPSYPEACGDTTATTLAHSHPSSSGPGFSNADSTTLRNLQAANPRVNMAAAQPDGKVNLMFSPWGLAYPIRAEKSTVDNGNLPNQEEEYEDEYEYEDEDEDEEAGNSN